MCREGVGPTTGWRAGSTGTAGCRGVGGIPGAPVSIDSACDQLRLFFFSSRRRHTRFDCDWSSDVCSSDLLPDATPEVRRDLQELTDAARRGAELVHRLLGFSRHETLDLRPLSVPEWIREELHTLRRLLPATIEIRCDTEPAAGVVEADSGALEQILLNLATNARDAMPDGGTLHLDVRRTRLDAEDRPLHAWLQPGVYVCLSVSDTGAGLDRQTQAHVFEPFFTTKPAGAGTGIGMAMVYGLVKQHHGFVHLYSEVGQGTTVKVYLPLGHEQVPPAGPAGEEELLPGGSDAILLVEDDPHLRSVAQRLCA